MVKEVSQALGPVGILVNNAGIAERRSLLETTPEAWARNLAVNLTGVFLCTRALCSDAASYITGEAIAVMGGP